MSLTEGLFSYNNCTMWTLCLLGCLFVVHVQGRARMQGVCSRNSRGCSSPLEVDMTHKRLFSYACDRFDLCYVCGSQRGHTKYSCDDIFSRDLRAVCSASTSTHDRELCQYFAAVYVTENSSGKKFHSPIERPSFCTSELVHSCVPFPHM
ncbi:hypothetical protein BaRGS_00009849 [Batillaria attramentaria]|uniref:Uncharacterized protein n=1 Tax=Batillaria attramentaria TaxID=370345 RepID=A0ABD0LHC7_9CAEN